MCAHFREKKLMTDDPLKILRFVASDFLQFKYVKTTLRIILFVQVITVFAALYYILFVFEDFKTKVVSLAFAMGEFYPILVFATLLYKDKLISHIHEEIPLWSIDNAGPAVRSRIRLEAKVLTIFACVTLSIGLCGGLLTVPNLQYDVELYIAIRIIQQYCPKHFRFLAFLYKLILATYGYVLNVHSIQVMYYTQHCRYQIMMSKELAQMFEENPKKIKEKYLFYNEEYQKGIEKALKFSIIRGQDLVNGQQNKIEEIGNLIAGFSVCGWLWGISVIIITASGISSSAYYPLILFMALGSILSFSGMIIAGQSVETETEQLALALTKVKWYNFNQSNKILYKFMTLHLSKPRKIKFSENLCINYQLGLRIVKGLYSVAMLFSKVN